MTKTLAHTCSWLFNPGCLVMISLLSGVGLTQSLTKSALAGWLTTLIVAGLLGTIVSLVAWARGHVLDADLMTPINLVHRSQIIIVFLGFLLILLFASIQMNQPQPLHAILVSLLILGLMVAGITMVWKISLHMLGATSLATFLLLLDGIGWWPTVIILVLIAWARLELKRHTPLQLLAGTVLGFLVPAIVFSYYRLV